jgi:hypothetical protein
MLCHLPMESPASLASLAALRANGQFEFELAHLSQLEIGNWKLEIH